MNKAMHNHDINKRLAEVAGVEVRQLPPDTIVVNDECSFHTEEGGWYFNRYDRWKHDGKYAHDLYEWNPLTDHNQMALVEAGLRNMNMCFDVKYDWVAKAYEVAIYPTMIAEDYGGYSYPEGLFEGYHSNKLRAMAEAVVKMGGDAS